MKSYYDLDILLKKAKQVKSDKKKWLFVIGIEKYRHTDNISYARRSAEMFAKTAKKRLGVPERNSIVLLDDRATQAGIKTSMRKMIKRVKKDVTIYFY